MDKMVVRQHPIGLLFGGMFALAAIGAGVATVDSFLREGIKVNGVVTQSGSDLAMLLGFLSIFLLVGGGVLAYTWNHRIEMSEEGVTVYDLLSRPVLSASWSEVSWIQAVRRGKVWAWNIAAGQQSAKIPIHSWPEERLLVGFARWAPLESFGEGTAPGPRPESESVHRFRSLTLLYPMFFAVLWNGFLVVMIWGMLGGFANSQELLASGLAVAITSGFVAIGIWLAGSTWGVFLRGRLVINPDGLELTSFIGRATELAWHDIRCAVESEVSTGRAGQRKLVLASQVNGLSVTSDLSNYEAVRDRIVAALPSNARVVLLDS